MKKLESSSNSMFALGEKNGVYPCKLLEMRMSGSSMILYGRNQVRKFGLSELLGCNLFFKLFSEGFPGFGMQLSTGLFLCYRLPGEGRGYGLFMFGSHREEGFRGELRGFARSHFGLLGGSDEASLRAGHNTGNVALADFMAFRRAISKFT